MDNNEMLYEISLKYNTLKMYENTLDQMAKHGSDQGAIEKIKNEKDAVEKELLELFNPKTSETKTSIKSPKMGNEKAKEVSNSFLNKCNEKAELEKMYSDNFFSKVRKDETVPVFNATINKCNSNKQNFTVPTFAKIQEKISQSEWISESNFIVRFDKENLDIDEWRIADVEYYFEEKTNGELRIIVNDFVDYTDVGDKKILSSMVFKKMNENRNIGDVALDIVNNNGETLYRLLFKQCVLNDVYPGRFDYKSTALHTLSLGIIFSNVIVLDVDEAAY